MKVKYLVLMILILVVSTLDCKNSKDDNQKVITKTESKESNLIWRLWVKNTLIYGF